MEHPCCRRNWTGGGKANKKITALNGLELIGGHDALKHLKDKQGRELCIHLGSLGREVTTHEGMGKHMGGRREVWTGQTFLWHFFCCLGGRCCRSICPPHLAIALSPTAGRISLASAFPRSGQIPMGLQKDSASSSPFVKGGQMSPC